MKKPEWSEKVTFKRAGENFLVEVVGWESTKWDFHTDKPCPVMLWNVYFYIYSGHPLFITFSGNEQMFDCPLEEFTGVSFFKKHIDEKGKVSSYQWGNDYDHLWNEGWSSDDKKHAAMKEAEYTFGMLSAMVSAQATPPTTADQSDRGGE